MNTIIIDTDPGVDDALAIAFGIKAGLPIASLVTVYGNAPVEATTRNALTILELSKANIPVYKGADEPLKGKARLAQSHGEDGLGGFTLELHTRAQEETALTYYKKILSESPQDSVTVIAIGPLTNLGQLVIDSPELFQKIKSVIIMGGVFGEKGNVSPYAEFNIYNDPLALKTVLDSQHPQITIVPANICRKVAFTQAIFDQIDNEELAAGLAKISQVYIDYYTGDSEYANFEGGVMYDLLAIAFLVEPRLFKLHEEKVRVEVKDTATYGLTETIFGDPNCKVVTSVDVEELKKLYISVMNR